MLVIQSEKQAARFFPPFIHALEGSHFTSDSQCCMAEDGGVYGALMAVLEQMLPHLPAQGASNSCGSHGPSD